MKANFSTDDRGHLVIDGLDATELAEHLSTSLMF